MNKKDIRFDNSIECKVSLFKYNDSLYNLPGYEKFIPLINKITSYELTKKQRICFNLYYYEEMSMTLTPTLIGSLQLPMSLCPQVHKKIPRPSWSGNFLLKTDAPSPRETTREEAR